MRELIPVLAADEIHLLVKNMAQRISADYRDRELVMVAVLKGAFVFLADLIRQLTIPVQVDFLQACSYGAGTQSCGAVRLVKDIGVDIRRKDVLLVEDIVDTGRTVNWILDHLKSFQPLSVSVCTLIDKRERTGNRGADRLLRSCDGKGFSGGLRSGLRRSVPSPAGALSLETLGFVEP